MGWVWLSCQLATCITDMTYTLATEWWFWYQPVTLPFNTKHTFRCVCVCVIHYCQLWQHIQMWLNSWTSGNCDFVKLVWKQQWWWWWWWWWWRRGPSCVLCAYWTSCHWCCQPYQQTCWHSADAGRTADSATASLVQGTTPVQLQHQLVALSPTDIQTNNLLTSNLERVTARGVVNFLTDFGVSGAFCSQFIGYTFDLSITRPGDLDLDLETGVLYCA